MILIMLQTIIKMHAHYVEKQPTIAYLGERTIPQMRVGCTQPVVNYFATVPDFAV